MDRRGFLKRFSIGVLACSMLRDALLAPLELVQMAPVKESLHYEYMEYGLGFRVSKQFIEEGLYGDIRRMEKVL